MGEFFKNGLANLRSADQHVGSLFSGRVFRRSEQVAADSDEAREEAERRFVQQLIQSTNKVVNASPQSPRELQLSADAEAKEQAFIESLITSEEPMVLAAPLPPTTNAPVEHAIGKTYMTTTIDQILLSQDAIPDATVDDIVDQAVLWQTGGAPVPAGITGQEAVKGKPDIRLVTVQQLLDNVVYLDETHARVVGRSQAGGD